MNRSTVTQAQREIRIVLVEPEHPGNIGAAARAMKTMGLKDLHLIKPSRFPDPQADWRAAAALDIIEDAQVHSTLDTAIADCQFVTGTTARDRHVPWPIYTAEEFGEKVRTIDTSLPIAILFGRETSGLTNEEFQRCNAGIRIPSSRGYSSLNLAMAVQIVTYEIFKSVSDGSVSKQWDRPLAREADVRGVVDQVERICDLVGFFGPNSPRHALIRFRRLFNRLELDETEVKLLRGLFGKVEKFTKNQSE